MRHLNAQEILELTKGHCPAHDDARPSLSVNEENGRLLIYCHRGCSYSQILAALAAHGIRHKPKRKGSCASRSIPDSNENFADKARKLWARSIPIGGTLAERYLQHHRDIPVTPAPEAVRFLPWARAGWRQPAMIVGLSNDDDEVMAVQLTYLDPESCDKADVRLQRQTFGMMGNSAVRLSAPRDRFLGLAEGVETALSVMQLFNVPCWACLSAARLGKIKIPKGVRTVCIFADNDEPGLDAARKAVRVYRSWGYSVEVRYPKQHGYDFNDVLLKRCQQ